MTTLPALLLLLLAFASPQVEVEGLLSAHGYGKPKPDAALDRVASVLAERLSGATSATPPTESADLLSHLLARAQISDAQVLPYTLRHSALGEFTTQLPLFVARLDRTKPPTHFGLSTFIRGREMTTTLLLVHRGVLLSVPLPRQGATGGFVAVHGGLERGYFRPRVLFAPPNGGRVRDRPAWTLDRHVDATVFFDAGPGIYGVEIVADSQYGPVVLNNHLVYVGVPVPALPVLHLMPPEYEGPPDLAFVRLVNEQRSAHGVPVLRLWPELTEVAREHALELSEQHVLVHATAESGNLTTRLTTRGLRFTQAAENLADAAFPRQALAVMLSSPGHKRNLLDPRWTHAGIGLVGRYYVLDMVRLAP